jgi:membrane-bound metal-dependent hydrolase YbcI (DUF457 family)
MKRVTHNVFSFATNLWILRMLEVGDIACATLVSVSISIIVNWVIDSLAGHKGHRRTPYTHSLTGAFIITLLLTIATHLMLQLLGIHSLAHITLVTAVLVLLTSLTHLLLDTFTVDGVELLWPFRYGRISLSNRRYDDPSLNTLFIVLAVILVTLYIISM